MRVLITLLCMLFLTSPAIAESDYLLQLMDKNVVIDGGYVQVVGRVKNISDKSLKNVTAVVEFYDGSNKFINYDSTIIEYNPILPGQVSPFQVYTAHVSGMKKFEISFKFILGGQIPTKK